MKKLIFALLCLLVAVPAWATDYELYYQQRIKQCESYVDAILKEKPKSQFFKVIGEDIRLRKDRVTGWKIGEDWYKIHEDKNKQCKCGYHFTSDKIKIENCRWIKWVNDEGCYKWTAAVFGSYCGGWYTLYIGKDKQDAINWLDRNVP
jgi:hypothetical protein